MSKLLPARRRGAVALLLALLAALAACGQAARPAAEPTPAPASAGQVTTRIVVYSGRVSGKSVVEIGADGAIHAVFDVLENGRGPHVDAKIRLAADGTIASYQASGHETMGTKLAESFRRDGAHARWDSEAEHGERDVAGAAFFLPMASTPEVTGWLVRAALAAGGTLPLLPDGEVRVADVATVEISAGGVRRTVHCYELTGLWLAPTYTWLDADGGWFGDVGPSYSMVPEGWADAVQPLVERQQQLERAHDERLATELAHRPPAAGLAYRHARVLDVARGRWLPDQTVLIVGDTIAKVGPDGKVAIPAGAEVVDLAGAALLPGLIDMHAHLGNTDGIMNLASGVTTARDVGNNPDELDDLKKRWDDGSSIGPHVVRMGFIEGRNEKAAASVVTAETPEEALAAVELFASRGYDGIKIYNSVRPELVPIITAAAHAKHMLVTGHIPVHMLAEDAVRAGYDGIEHVNMLFLEFFATRDTDTRDTTRFTLVGDHAAELDLGSKPVLDFFALLREHGTVLDPTLVAFEDLYVGKSGRITPGLEGLVGRLPVQIQRYFLVGGLPGDKTELYARAFDKLLAMVFALYDAKLPVVLGTDSLAGLMLHHEMALFARAGIPNAAILEMATLGAARAMKLDRTIGSIEAGKRADLIVVDGDPLADIAAITRVRSAMRGGVTFESAALYRAVGVDPVP